MIRNDQSDFFREAIANGMYSNRRRLKRHLGFIFGDQRLADRRVLDIGSGTGLLTFYAAASGAMVTSIEPEIEGASQGVLEQLESFRASHRFGRRVAIVPATFQSFEPTHSFDLVVMANSVNHLNEAQCERLHFSEDARTTYRAYFAKIYDLLERGGSLIVTDCDRSNAFNDLGMVSPFMRSIEWHKHQSPRVWMNLLEGVGLETVSVKWSVPNVLGPLGIALLSNRVTAYFLLSHFRLEVRKPW